MEMPPAGNPMLSVLPQSRWRFAFFWLHHFACTTRIACMAVAVAVAAAVAYAICHGDWVWAALATWTALMLVLAGIHFGLSDYKFEKKHGSKKRIDQGGISKVWCDADGRYFCHLSWPWTHIKRVYFYNRFVVIVAVNDKGLKCWYLLPTAKPYECRKTIMHYWWLSTKGISPENQPSYYSKEERKAVENFIATRFGQPSRIIYDRYLADLDIDLAIINPSKDKPYYTVCTIGAGAYVMGVPYKLHQECHAEQRTEYVTYLPPEWNAESISLEEERNSWPMDIMRICAQEAQLDKTFTMAGRMIRYSQPFAPSTEAQTVFLTHPLPDLRQPMCANLQTSCTVGFLQMAFLTNAESEKLLNLPISGDNILTVLDVAPEKLKAALPEERGRLFAEALMRHFRQITPPAMVL